MPAAKPGLEATLRFEMVSDEGRALLMSYLIATLLAVVWLMVVRFAPTPARKGVEIPRESPVTVVVQHPEPLELSFGPRDPDDIDRGRATPASAPGNDIRKIFGGDLRLVDAGKLLRGIDVTVARGAATEHARKVGLGTDVGSRTPGLSRGESGPSSAGGVGVVRGNGVSRSAMIVAPPDVRAVSAGTASGDIVEVGQAVRARAPQLERCYFEEGLARNASLAGLVRLAIEVEAGQVRSARVVERSWSGEGAAETESCLERTTRRWRLGTLSARIVLPLSFTNSARDAR
jgi:hypothetical protein